TVNSFVLCLIDGDGYVFDDNLIKQGAFGGGEAASRLLDNIKRHVQQYDGAIHWKIIIRIYANLEGLLKKYAYIGFIEQERSLRQFVWGLTQSQPLFDFVDVGQGKERADHKIRAHDNGYVPTLDLYKNNQTSAAPISLLKPMIVGREYQGLPFEFVQFDSIFRKEELPNTRPTYAHQAHSMNFKPTALAPVKQNHRSSVTGITRPFYPRPVYLNAYDERVDEVLELPNGRADAKLEQRIRNTAKLCNDFHLKGECRKPAGCGFDHEPALEGEELLAFALRA
ncbi:MAG: hypothetical protein Q9183_005333, partial [Haloplaca sp. 2 TL-2023]